jgi:hypothetical protein
MSFKNQNYQIQRFTLLLALLGLILATLPVTSARAGVSVVTNTSDSGPGSLRQAIADATPGDTITFAPWLNGGIIRLHSQLLVNKDLTIDGSELSPQLTLSGGGDTRIIQADWPAEVTISGLVLSGGLAEKGGAILANGSFTAINSTFLNNRAVDGGALWGGGIKLINSTLRGNYAVGDGGAITSVSLHIENSTIAGNQSDNEGGAISIWGDGRLTIVNSTISQNHAGNSGGGMFLTGYPIVNIYNSTFAENMAVNGHEFVLDEVYQITLKNTVFVCNGEDDACYVTAAATILNTNSILGIGTIQDYITAAARRRWRCCPIARSLTLAMTGPAQVSRLLAWINAAHRARRAVIVILGRMNMAS